MRLATLLVLIVGTHAVPLSSRSSAMQMAKEVYAVAPHAKHAQPDLLPSHRDRSTSGIMNGIASQLKTSALENLAETGQALSVDANSHGLINHRDSEHGNIAVTDDDKQAAHLGCLLIHKPDTTPQNRSAAALLPLLSPRHHIPCYIPRLFPRA